MQIRRREEDVVYTPPRTIPRQTLMLDYGRGAPEVTVVINNDTTIAFVEFELFGETLQATGSSKKHPNDTTDHDVGVAYAVSRAFWEMGKALQREAGDRVRLADERRRWSREEFDLEPLEPLEPVEYEEKEPHPKQDPGNRTKEELRLACKRKGLPTAGPKWKLIERLEEYDRRFRQ